MLELRRLKKAEKDGERKDPESAASQSNGGFQVPSSLMGQMSKKVKSSENVESQGVRAKKEEGLPLDEMPTPERPSRGVRRPPGPVTPTSEAQIALLGQSTKTKSPNTATARKEFFKDLQKDQTS